MHALFAAVICALEVYVVFKAEYLMVGGNVPTLPTSFLYLPPEKYMVKGIVAKG